MQGGGSQAYPKTREVYILANDKLELFVHPSGSLFVATTIDNAKSVNKVLGAALRASGVEPRFLKFQYVEDVTQNVVSKIIT